MPTPLSSPDRGVQTQLSPFRKQTLVQITFNTSNKFQVSNTLSVPANPPSSWAQE